MRYFTVGAENGADVRIYYEDHDSGQPVVLIQGYRSTHTAWERKERVLLAVRYQVIAYDRSGQVRPG
jgi:non-heme chloroperoxidase